MGCTWDLVSWVQHQAWSCFPSTPFPSELFLVVDLGLGVLHRWVIAHIIKNDQCCHETWSSGDSVVQQRELAEWTLSSRIRVVTARKEDIWLFKSMQVYRRNQLVPPTLHLSFGQTNSFNSETYPAAFSKLQFASTTTSANVFHSITSFLTLQLIGVFLSCFLNLNTSVRSSCILFRSKEFLYQFEFSHSLNTFINSPLHLH